MKKIIKLSLLINALLLALGAHAMDKMRRQHSVEPKIVIQDVTGSAADHTALIAASSAQEHAKQRAHMIFERYLTSQTQIEVIKHDLFGSPAESINPLYPIDQCIETIKLLVNDSSPLTYEQKINFADTAIQRPFYQNHQDELQKIRNSIQETKTIHQPLSLQQTCINTIGTQCRTKRFKVITDKRAPLAIRSRIACETLPDSILASWLLMRENPQDPSIYYHRQWVYHQPRRLAQATKNAAIVAARRSKQKIINARPAIIHTLSTPTRIGGKTGAFAAGIVCGVISGFIDSYPELIAPVEFILVPLMAGTNNPAYGIGFGLGFFPTLFYDRRRIRNEQNRLWAIEIAAMKAKWLAEDLVFEAKWEGLGVAPYFPKAPAREKIIAQIVSKIIGAKTKKS